MICGVTLCAGSEWESAHINCADDFAVMGTQESFANDAREACRLSRLCQTDLFSFFQVCQHHYGRRLLLPNHAPKVSHCLELWAWNETDAFGNRRNPIQSAEAWILPWAAINLFFSLKPWGEKKTISILCQFSTKKMIINGHLRLCRMHLCSLNTDVRHDSAPLWNDHLWKRGEAALAFLQFQP